MTMTALNESAEAARSPNSLAIQAHGTIYCIEGKHVRDGCNRNYRIFTIALEPKNTHSGGEAPPAPYLLEVTSTVAKIVQYRRTRDYSHIVGRLLSPQDIADALTRMLECPKINAVRM